MNNFVGEYLEKIIQAPFLLPPADQLAINRMLLRRLNEILERTAQRRFDESHWRVVFQGVQGFIKTPRGATRLANMMEITYARPEVHENVDFADFVGVETLRVFLSRVKKVRQFPA